MKLYEFVIIFGSFMMILAQIPSFHSLRHINLVSLVLCLAYSACATAGSIYIGKNTYSQCLLFTLKLSLGIYTVKFLFLSFLLGSSSKGPEKDYSLSTNTETRVFGIFNAIAIIATAFGNGIIPEIQVSKITIDHLFRESYCLFSSFSQPLISRPRVGQFCGSSFNITNCSLPVYYSPSNQIC